ncbi:MULTISPECIES: MAB_1171c family putative transporter [unclassified Streptomyces]|uniref:MAB_1171c family putative transporter n=1 Tax=unclassified Streptomyces TaxID=2593676 RepID=UPI00344E88E8
MSRHLGVVAVALVWTIVLWRAPAAVRVPTSRALWAGFCALAAALTVRLPPVRNAIELMPSAQSLSLLLMHLLGLAAIGFLLRWIRLMGFGDGVPTLPLRLDLALTTGVAAAMTALFFLTGRAGRQSPFPVHAAHSAPATAYLWLWFAYLGVAMVRAAVLFCNGYLRSTKGLLRAGLGITAAGFLVGVLYALLRMFLLTGYRPAVLPSGAAAEEVAHTAQFTAVLLIGLGTSLPVGSALLQSLERYRRLHRLRALWHPLTEAVPHVVLGVPPTRLDDFFSGGSLELRLHRRMIEIRDACLALREHIPQSLPDRAQSAAAALGLSGPEREAVVEAFCLSNAVRARRVGQPPSRTPAPYPPGARDRDAESAWLTRVSIAYRSSHMSTLDRLLEAPTTPPSPTGPARRPHDPRHPANNAPGRGYPTSMRGAAPHRHPRSEERHPGAGRPHRLG